MRLAVPDGASSFAAWWYSMISARSIWRTASAAKRIISTAPIAKFGATKTFAEPPSATARSSSTSKPVVPTTACTPACTASRTLATAVSGRVKSTTTSASPSTLASAVLERRVGAARQPQVLGRFHRGAHGLPEAARGPGDRDPDHAAATTVALGQTSSTAPRNASSSGPMPAADRRDGAHSSATSSRRSASSTASMRAMISSSSSSGRS